MSFIPLCKVTCNSALFLRSTCNRNSVFTSLKLCANKLTMEIANGVITKPYQNGISSLKSENVKWKSEKKLESLPRPIAVCGPSGSGKSTLLKRFLAEYKDYVEFSISHTTRKPRPNEVDGKDYHFVSRDDMEKAIANGEFLEHAEFSGNIYGTSKNAVKQILKNGKLCILDVEMVGVKNLKKTDLNPKFIFVKTPSIEVLEERLRNRNTESEESLQKRLARAKEELVYGGTPGNFDLVLVNDDLEEAYRALKEFLLPDVEGLKRRMSQ